jgi:trans-aconitate methyltransferase
MTDPQLTEEWSSGAAYEAYIGRWSRVVAHQFVTWLGVGSGLRWLDVGCGTGALTAAALELTDPAEVLGIDASAAYAEEARRRVADRRATFEWRDAASIETAARFDLAVSGLVINFLPDQAAVVGAMGRAAMPGGVVAAYVWDYAHRMELLRYFWNAVVRLDESAGQLDEAVRFPICEPAALAALWADVGLESVETTAIDAETRFADFDDYWSPFLGGQGPGPGYVRGLEPAGQAALREAIRATLPIAADGSISLIARAWAVQGIVPS